MKKNKNLHNYKVATYTVVLAFLLLNVASMFSITGYMFDMLKPFIIGIAIAFVLNILLNFFERKVFCFIDNTPFKNKRGLKRGLSLLSTVVFLFGIFTALMIFVLPQLAESIKVFIDSIPGYTKSLETVLAPVLSSTELFSEMWSYVVSAWQDILQVSMQLATSSISSIISTTVTATTSVVNIVIGFVFAIYMLIEKESIITQTKKMLHVFVGEAKAVKIIKLGDVINETFSKFLAGQCTEAFILAVLCFVGMNIFNMPYALLVSTIVGVTNLLPVVGPFIGAIPCVFIIFMVNPTQAFWFIVFILVIQQIDSNLIYPKVVGTSIGLSAMWVLLAILIGGNLGGPIGMLLGVPTIAVIHKVLGRYINSKLPIGWLGDALDSVKDTPMEDNVEEIEEGTDLDTK